MKINKSFFNYFQGYNLTEVAKEVLNLDIVDKEIILSIWGEKPTVKYNDKVDDIILRIKNNIGKKSLKDKLKCNNANIIREFLVSLNPTDKMSILKEYYLTFPAPKEDLDEETVKHNEMILSNIIIEENEIISLYKRYYDEFPEFTKEEVDTIFQFNSEFEKKIMYKKFGVNFQNIYYNKYLTREDNDLINNTIIPTMKKRMIKIRKRRAFIVKIGDLYPHLTEEQIKKRKYRLPLADKERLSLLFGKNFKGEAYVDKTENYYINSDGIIKRIHKEHELKELNTKVTKECNKDFDSKYNTINRLLKMTKGKSLLKIYDENTTLAIMTILYLDEEVTDEELYRITGKHKEEIYELVRDDDRVLDGLPHRKYAKILNNGGENYENK